MTFEGICCMLQCLQSWLSIKSNKYIYIPIYIYFIHKTKSGLLELKILRYCCFSCTLHFASPLYSVFFFHYYFIPLPSLLRSGLSSFGLQRSLYIFIFSFFFQSHLFTCSSDLCYSSLLWVICHSKTSNSTSLTTIQTKISKIKNPTLQTMSFRLFKIIWIFLYHQYQKIKKISQQSNNILIDK